MKKSTSVLTKVGAVAFAVLTVVAAGTGSASAAGALGDPKFQQHFNGQKQKNDWNRFVRWVKSWF